eukprot:CAMPEP_0197542310 /NCGR_PEP_ID=MMETSP1318-20131121/67635_1 /TAXON_ID=552666 /ORGANISM="Partenskyella glossopodia, Strain RCC365" /LENGTH=113 /DNA_ID=CAMNT_0043101565 /DNA_START=1187 /DNA_END=1528 /DNA_ORIENTATION=-
MSNQNSPVSRHHNRPHTSHKHSRKNNDRKYSLSETTGNDDDATAAAAAAAADRKAGNRTTPKPFDFLPIDDSDDSHVYEYGAAAGSISSVPSARNSPAPRSNHSNDDEQQRHI